MVEIARTTRGMLVGLGMVCVAAAINAKSCDEIITPQKQRELRTYTILETHDVAFIQNKCDELNKITKNLWVVFDCDDTLVSKTDKNVFKNSCKEFFASVKIADEKNWETNSSEILAKSEIAPTDPAMVQMVRNLQETGVKTIVLTQCGRGKLGNIENMENWRARGLIANGYNFAKTWEGIGAHVYGELRSNTKRFIPTSSNTPGFNDGILYACDASKGAVLKAFITENFDSQTEDWPDRIVYVDDSLEAVNDVCEIITKDLCIDVLGIHYIPPIAIQTSEISNHEFSNDEELIDPNFVQSLQKEVLLVKHQYIPEDVVRIIVEKARNLQNVKSPEATLSTNHKRSRSGHSLSGLNAQDDDQWVLPGSPLASTKNTPFIKIKARNAGTNYGTASPLSVSPASPTMPQLSANVDSPLAPGINA